MMAKKTTIDDYKNRMASPVVGVRINPKTGRPIKKRTTKGKK